MQGIVHTSLEHEGVRGGDTAVVSGGIRGQVASGMRERRGGEVRREGTEYYGRREDEASKTTGEKKKPSNPQCRLPWPSSSSSSTHPLSYCACRDMGGAWWGVCAVCCWCCGCCAGGGVGVGALLAARVRSCGRGSWPWEWGWVDPRRRVARWSSSAESKAA